MKIYYTGIGRSDNKKYFTEEEFLHIMNAEFTNKTVFSDEQLDFGEWNLPADFGRFTLSDWIEYSGAVMKNNKN